MALNREGKHILLTGERGVGKSTAIRRLTGRLLVCGARIGGFETAAGPAPGGDAAPGRDAVYMLPYRADAGERVFSEDCIVAIRDRRAARYEAYAAVFDGIGTELLRRAAQSDLIVMDELGFMEAEARVFQDAVLSLLDGARPVLGVVKPPSASKNVAFLERLRTHPNVRLFPLTRENRDAAPACLRSLLSRLL